MESTDSVVLNFKCGREIDCSVKKTIIAVMDVNLKIHLFRNCIACNGKKAPNFDTIS